MYEWCRGNLEFASFMETVDQEWKNQYIGGFISAAAPWSGASGVRYVIACGDQSQGTNSLVVVAGDYLW